LIIFGTCRKRQDSVSIGAIVKFPIKYFNPVRVLPWRQTVSGVSGGSFKTESIKETGTTVRVSWPL